MGGCADSGSDGAAGAAGAAGAGGVSQATDTTLDEAEDLPGCVLAITALSGGSGTGGNFQVGDKITVTFTIKKNDGTNLPASELGDARIYVSGPTFNYQRVIASTSNWHTAATQNPDGSWTYQIPTAIPATYLAPIDDTATFTAGELTGTALLSGTYTVGMQAWKTYTQSDGTSVRDAGSTTKDFLFGTAVTLDPREVVKKENCNQCHVNLEAHSHRRRDTKLCVLCHTAGMEDTNDPLIEGGTPDVTLEFKVMIHKIHNAAHLPSVLGVTTNPDGTRNYAATPKPYVVVDGTEVDDMSEISFPVMPSAYVGYTYGNDGSETVYQGASGNGPMPRDVGYLGLTASQKLQEDKIRTGVVACWKCHGDPDGSGPLTAPAQGDNYKTMPSRRVCGACHDDVVWTNPYAANGLTMAAGWTDSSCAGCHVTYDPGDPPTIENAHTHPYSGSLNTGVNVTISAVGGGTGPGGNHQTNDNVSMTFSVKNDAGTNLQINSQLTRFQMMVTGPTSNPQNIFSNISMFDHGWRKAGANPGGGTGYGSVKLKSVAAGAVAQTLWIHFTAVNTFDLVGTVSGTLLTGTVVPGGGTTGDLTQAGVTFEVVDTATTDFTADEWYYLEVIPLPAVGDTYTYKIRADNSSEVKALVAAPPSTTAVTASNLPMYYGWETLFEVTAFGGGAQVLAANSAASGRYVETATSVAALQGVGIDVDKDVVIDLGTADEEYVKVGRFQTTDDFTGAALANTRIWFTSALKKAHVATDAFQNVTMTKRRRGLHYNFVEATGVVTLTDTDWTAGNRIVMNYRSDAKLKSTYGAPSQDSDDIGIDAGDWKTLNAIDGTYTAAIWSNRDFTVKPDSTSSYGYSANSSVEAWNKWNSDNTTYRMISPPATKLFLFGNADMIEPRAIISSGDTCDSCHGQLMAHGFGRRGLDTCLVCHAISGMEDGPKYNIGSAKNQVTTQDPEKWKYALLDNIGVTPGVAMEFRTMVHKIHRGMDLANAMTYSTNGIFLGIPYPASYEDVGFPARPGGVKHCDKCHGSSNNAWKEPEDRSHPTQQTVPLRRWRTVCLSCHDSNDTRAHYDLNTSASGYESCATCHGEGKVYNVQLMHKSR
ncbi:MAG: hypothetical protein HYY17_11805, partial [Planctomycetes bacterium]|nr:hypothetical protein [Planctomycetota bacterium]